MVGAGGGAGTGAVVNATVGVGGTLTFTVANGGTGLRTTTDQHTTTII